MFEFFNSTVDIAVIFRVNCLSSFVKKIYGFAVEGLYYKPIDKYWDQIFNIVRLLKDKNEYLLETPLKSKKNRNRIEKNLSKLLRLGFQIL